MNPKAWQQLEPKLQEQLLSVELLNTLEEAEPQGCVLPITSCNNLFTVNYLMYRTLVYQRYVYVIKRSIS